MQFIINGPDIPDELLRAHEEGQVVFFCGAGISRPAGLPDFKGLVEQIYRINKIPLKDIEHVAFKRGQFDVTLDLLERRLPGQRLKVRQALFSALKPDSRRKGAVETHGALLRLARNREGMLRLVTTNFDRLFHTSAKRSNQKFQSYSAPMLPIPKSSRWDGLVFLHGLLPHKPDESSLNRLVLTSGDFGLAYLTERWASRFVTELFRNYVVCFVGYGINDPVMRYMMDALAADRMLGEDTLQAWALAPCEPGKENDKAKEWVAKGVTPILYKVPIGNKDHSAMQGTLQKWAETYRDGAMGKERIVVTHALASPSHSTQQDDFVGRMLWALSDESGLPAKRFAEFNPAPPLDWLLEVFSKPTFKHCNLVWFGGAAYNNLNNEFRYSLVNRPAQPGNSSIMQLVSDGYIKSGWDAVMENLGRWLLRHLGDPRLVLWIADHGGKLESRWSKMIEPEIDAIATLQLGRNTSELDKIRLHAPKAIPCPSMLKLWRIILAGRLKSSRNDLDLYNWHKRLKQEGLTSTLRIELRELLAPKVTLMKPFIWDQETENLREPKKLRSLVNWEIVLTSDLLHTDLRENKDSHWVSALPRLLEDFQQLLQDALDLMSELGGVDDQNDRSFWDLPSISSHPQNRGTRDWVCLIEFLRDSWVEVRNQDNIRAAQIASVWFSKSYSTFKRLALFAASQEEGIKPEVWCDWLLVNDAKWLWSENTCREICRLLALKGDLLSKPAQERLELAILTGPLRKLHTTDLGANDWQKIVSRATWLRLAKLKSSGATLGVQANTRLEELSNSNPQWKMMISEREEFLLWSSIPGDSDYEERNSLQLAPRKRNELVKWLKKPPSNQQANCSDTWQEVCRTRFFHSLLALCDLAQNGNWPTSRWGEALQVWSEEEMVLRSWRNAAQLVQTMPDPEILEIIRSLVWWIETVSKTTKLHEDIFLNLCHRVLQLPLEESSRIKLNNKPINRPLTEAINHPFGRIAQALMNWWLDGRPKDNDSIPENIKSLFTKLCDVQIDALRHGRVLLGSRLIALFRVDSKWTELYLLPSFDWKNPGEAKAVWEGFLWSPRLYAPVMVAFKSQFLETADHYNDLVENKSQFAVFLTYAALDQTEGFTTDDFRSAFEKLPQDGLEESAEALVQALEGSANQREEYWKNRVRPFWEQVWPKSLDCMTPQIAESLSRLIVAAGGEFPNALSAVQDWLQPIGHSNHVVHLLHKSGLCSRYPVEALQLLGALFVEQQWPPSKMRECLDAIQQSSPQIEENDQFKRLNEYLRKRGMA